MARPHILNRCPETPAKPPDGPQVVTFDVHGMRFAALSVCVDDDRLAALTEAEREVAALAAASMTNAAIAKCRGSSERTVANQMASVLRKLKVGSRYGLAAYVARGRGPGGQP